LAVRVIALRHHREDDPGLVGEEFARRGAVIDVHNVLRDGPIPDVATYDFAMVLGSKWSVYDRDSVGQWIDSELAFLRRADELGIAVLGICFGSQALCVAHGGVVESSGSYEIGWYQIESTNPGIASDKWFQFHGDRCLPSAQMEILATNELCVQAFSIRRNLGVQFHPEVERGQLERWLPNGGEVEMRNFGLNVDAVLAETSERYDQAVANVATLVDFFIEDIATR